jgi:MSHA biogenesis protein MshL
MKSGLAKMLALAALVAGCSAQRTAVERDIKAELDSAAQSEAPRTPARVEEALLPPLRMEIPAFQGQPGEQRFDLSVSNAPAAQVFMSLATGTRYSMLVHPNVGGAISIHLKDVTIREALDSIRELYGYEYRVEGSRIFVQPISIQTRVFSVNYLIGQRLGRSDLRVTSGSIADAPNIGTTGAGGTAGGAPGTGALLPGGVTDSSRIQTQTRNDFWDDLEKTLRAIVGSEPGRSVVVNPQAGVVVVRAMRAELRGVESYLNAIRMSVERQVVLEAKIIEVTLNSQYQTGINWAGFSAGGLSGGPASPGTTLQKRDPGGLGGPTQQVLGQAGAPTGPLGARTFQNPAFASFAGSDLTNIAVPGASLFGLAFQTRNFAALLTFLESQGAVQVLSSPRIATINNQKAVLKVGSDQFFLTSISGSSTTATTTTAGVTTPAFPTITLRPFFSGVALDITPQINEESEIILHIHPSVSDVQTDNRQIDLGGAFGGVVSLPLAKSNVSETDSVVRVGNGNIVAIGGLMKVDVGNNKSGLPGTQDTILEGLFNSVTRTMVKKELVILIKPTVVQSGVETQRDAREARERILQMLPSDGESRR